MSPSVSIARLVVTVTAVTVPVQLVIVCPVRMFSLQEEAKLDVESRGFLMFLEQHGVIGLSADEDPSAATLIALADMMESSGIFSVMVDPVYKQSYGQALKSDLESRTDHTVTILDVFLALGPYKDPSGNADYLDQLQRNLVSLKAGLGVA